MSTYRHSETAFETVIEAHLLENGYVQIVREGFDHERSFPRQSSPSSERLSRKSEASWGRRTATRLHTGCHLPKL